MAKHWSTQDVPNADRVAYWIDAVCDTYVQLECDGPRDGSPFQGSIALHQLATLGLSHVDSTTQWVRRTPAKIARDTEDYFLVSIQTAGNGRLVQDGRVAELSPGDFALYDSTRPYELIFGGAFQQYVLRLPGEMLRSRLRGTQTLTACTVSGQRGAGHLMISMIRSLAADLDTLEPASVAAVAESVEHILIAGLCALPGASPPPVSGLTAFHLEQIKAYARANLRDPKLSVSDIASRLRISPSTVHRVFSGEPDTITGWIWGQRLEGARRELCDPSLAARSVSEVAFGWGFNDAAHFSRAFRARFGCSARELRANCLKS